MSSSKPSHEADALRYTRTGVRSTHDVLTFLRRRGVAAAAARRILSRCQAAGQVDDRAAARLWAGHWLRRGYARRLIRERLAAKGFHERAIAQAMHDLGPSTEDEDSARRVAAQPRYRRSSRPRLARTLASRGFEAEVIERVLDASFGSIPSDAES
jgi:SOS response regulatory protein OraA/RecX